MWIPPEMNNWLAKVCYDLCLASWLSQLDADYSAKPIEIHSGPNQAFQKCKISSNYTTKNL